MGKWQQQFSIGYFVVALILLFALQTYFAAPRVETISYSQFKTLVKKGLVSNVVIGEKVIRGDIKPEGIKEVLSAERLKELNEKDKEAKTPLPFTVVRVDDPELTLDLEHAGVQFNGEVTNEWVATLLSWIVPVVLFFLLWSYLFKRMGSGGGLMQIGKSKAKVYIEKKTGVTFADVEGIDKAEEELVEVVEFLKNPQKYQRLGGRIPKGVLLVGPPGTGKTLLARAVAGEAGVPFFSISGSDFVEMFVGVGAARVRDLFDQAKQKAPCIIFVDELDALGKARGVGPVTHEEREQTLNQLLVELDGFDPRVGVILMAATNRPEILDPALLRAGRFDRHVLVDRPDKTARLEILRVHARKVPIDSEKDLEMIAGMTVGFVGADLANIINEAALLGVRRDRDKVGLAELQESVERVVAGLEKKNRVLSPDEKKRVAYHELGHALVASALPGADEVHKISIIPRGVAALGYTMQLPTEDRFLMTESELENKVATLLGGRVAEELIFDEVSTGAHDDLSKATDIARSMVKTFGMSPRLGQVSLEKDRRGVMLQSPLEPTARTEYSEQTARAIDDEVRRIIDEQRERVAEVLSRRRQVLVRAAQLLLAKETISGQELRDMMAAHESEPDQEP